MQNRRFPRLTNAFLKRFENHIHMLATTIVFKQLLQDAQVSRQEDSGDEGGAHGLRVPPSDMLALDMWSDVQQAA